VEGGENKGATIFYLRNRTLPKDPTPPKPINDRPKHSCERDPPDLATKMLGGTLVCHRRKGRRPEVFTEQKGKMLAEGDLESARNTKGASSTEVQHQMSAVYIEATCDTPPLREKK